MLLDSVCNIDSISRRLGLESDFRMLHFRVLEAMGIAANKYKDVKEDLKKATKDLNDKTRSHDTLSFEEAVEVGNDLDQVAFRVKRATPTMVSISGIEIPKNTFVKNHKVFFVCLPVSIIFSGESNTFQKSKGKTYISFFISVKECFFAVYESVFKPFEAFSYTCNIGSCYCNSQFFSKGAERANRHDFWNR